MDALSRWSLAWRAAGLALLGLLPLLVHTAALAQQSVGERNTLPPQELPDIGAPWESTLSKKQAQQLGRMIVHQLREADSILEDPELTAYVQALGHRLASRANEGEDSFSFFVVNDPTINAFALPGGFIGVNAGLIQATTTESELAGVLAHEVAHVTQDHIARRIFAQSQTGLATTAAMLAGILLSALAGAGPGAIQAAVSVSQGMAAQAAITHTRNHEYEADRIGLGILARSGFDPEGMPDFFETLGRRSGYRGSAIPEFLRTHPLEANRIAEARGRAADYSVGKVENSLEYELAKARLQVLLAETRTGAVAYFEQNAPQGILEADVAAQYGYATALIAADQSRLAIPFFQSLTSRFSHVTVFHSGLAEALIADGDVQGGLEVYERALRLFPRNIALTVRYSRALLNSGYPQAAHDLMLDLLNNIDYTAEQLRLLALAASNAGAEGDAHYYMSEFHVVNGNLPLALEQLRLALAAPALSAIQRERFVARIEEIERVIPKTRRQRRRERQQEQQDG